MNINEIDLQYLINPVSWEKLNKDCSFNELSQEDYEFYKPRIFKITKDILKDKEVDKKIKKCFMNYTKICIEHFKFIDKRDIIQKEYDERKNKNKNTNNFNMGESNNLIMKKTEFKKIKITDQIPIKTNIIPENIVMPKKRIFNLKDPKLKRKGI